MQKRKLIIALAVASALSTGFAQSTPAKKELAARIVKNQQAGIEGMARSLVEQPAAELLAGAGAALPSRVPRERQEAVAKEIQADVQKYVEENVPIVQARAVRLAPATVGGILEEKFTEDELKQIVSIMESPVYSKFQHMADDMQKALANQVVTDTRSTIEPRLRALEQGVAKRLGITAPPAGAAAPASPAAPKASGKR